MWTPKRYRWDGQQDLLHSLAHDGVLLLSPVAILNGIDLAVGLPGRQPSRCGASRRLRLLHQAKASPVPRAPTSPERVSSASGGMGDRGYAGPTFRDRDRRPARCVALRIEEVLTTTKPIILTFVGGFVPGFRGGGPIRSIGNLVAALSNDFHFRVITLDHDLGETDPYPGIVPDIWTLVGRAQVMYLSSHGQTLHRLWRLIRNTRYDAIYLNSAFDRRFSMFPYALWRLGLIKRTPLVLAPRGELLPGSLTLKHFKKSLYIKACNMMRWYQSSLLMWHASSELEAAEISRVLSGKMLSGIALPIPSVDNSGCSVAEMQMLREPKESGSLSIIFVSRISREKNLDFALRALAHVRGRVTFDICGPTEDRTYWGECQELIAALPAGIKVRYLGAVSHGEVAAYMMQHHVFLLPSRAENYGHVICEALLAGCPVIISDQTPWRNLKSAGVGWDIALNDVAAFHNALQECVDMERKEYSALSSRARAYGRARSHDEMVVDMNRELFERALKMPNRLSSTQGHLGSSDEAS